LHARRWEDRGEAGLFEAWRVDLIIEQAVRSIDGKLGPWMCEMISPQSGVIASLVLFRSHDAAAYYQLGWDPEWARLSIGKVIVAEAIAWAHREGMAVFDFLRGVEDYKYRLGAVDAEDLTLLSQVPASKILKSRERVVAVRRGERPTAREGLGSPLDGLLRRTPVQFAARRRAHSRLRVLCYHGIDDVASFRRQLEHLCDNYHPVTLSDVLASMEGGARLPDRAVLVSFDDGVRSQFVNALPELNRAQIKAIFFVVLGALDTRTAFWWEAVLSRRSSLSRFRLGAQYYNDVELLVTALKRVSDRERVDALHRLEAAYGPAPDVEQVRREDLRRAMASGHSVGNHSWSHPLLDRCDSATLAREMSRGLAAFSAEFPLEPLTFAYPNGNVDDRVERHLRDAGYRAAFLFDHRVADMRANPLRISRLRVNEKIREDRFEIVLSGLHPYLMHMRERRSE
jgi:peptidoglycan/xylan/chitin deacetylase (PgdA/CDA1 family)